MLGRDELNEGGLSAEPPEAALLSPVGTCANRISRITGYLRAMMLPLSWVTGGAVRRYCLTWQRIDRQQVTLDVFEGLGTSTEVLWKMTITGGGAISGWRPSPDPRWAITQMGLELVSQYEQQHEKYWRDIWNQLCDRQRYILRALAQNNAARADVRMRAVDIARRADGPQADPDNFKRPLSNLATLGLVQSKSGREGGYWLTTKGRDLLAFIDGDGAADCA